MRLPYKGCAQLCGERVKLSSLNARWTQEYNLLTDVLFPGIEKGLDILCAWNELLPLVLGQKISFSARNTGWEQKMFPCEATVASWESLSSWICICQD